MRKILVLFFVFLGLGTDVYPQLNALSEFELQTRKNRKVVIPFQLINNLIVLPLSINGSDSLNFVLDTGVGATLITEFPEGTEIGFNFLRTVKISGLGEGESIDVLYSPGNTIAFGKAVGIRQDILVMQNDIFQLSSLLGTNVHGLIGFAVFKDFIVEIDYKMKRIILHAHEKYSQKYFEKKNSDKWESLPITIYKQKPYIDVIINEKDGTTNNVKLLIDSGASHGMALYYSANDDLHLPSNRIRSFLGSGISGEINGYLGRVESLRMNSYEMKDVVAAYPDSAGIKRALVFSDRDGSIGADVLRRFKIFFNYRDESMIFKSHSTIREDFSYNISGLEIATPYPNIPLYSITNVREGSVAEKAGLMKEDLIIEINSKGAQTYTLSDVHRIFQSENKNVWLKIMRGDKTMTLRFRQVNELD